MTKEEVLQGALALNGSDKRYTVSVDGDQIKIQAQYYGTPLRKATFCCTTHLNDDNTYIETHFDDDGGWKQFGKVVKVKKSVSFTFGNGRGIALTKKEDFNSEDLKKILRDYLESCGYKRTKKGFFKKLFGK